MIELDKVLKSLKDSLVIWFLSVLIGAFISVYGVGYWARGIIDTRNKTEAKGGSINKDLSTQLDKAIKNHFESQTWLGALPGDVMAEAKGIVSRFENEVNVISSTETKIEEMKRTDANWTYANRLKDGLNLVKVLGLSENTKAKNQIFIEMIMSAIKPKEIPK